jgi:putative transposase
MDEGLLLRMLKGIASRNDESCAEAVPESFGLSSSTVSRRYVIATARKLAPFQERSLEEYDLVALFLDGKSFADEQIIIALGVTLDGQKIPLGFVEAATENERVCRRFLSDLVDRGLQCEAALLIVIDGAKGLYKAVISTLKGHAFVQRCQYHTRKNIESYLPKREQSRIGRKLEAAYAKPTYNAAKKALNALKPELKLTNQSALHSLEEGMEETLTLHRLGLMSMLGRSFRTTNCIENVSSLLQQLTHNVRHWKNSAQRYRWVATALLDIEPRLRRIQGYHQLPMLRQALKAKLGVKQLAKAG